jgi:hypothetical protein
MRIPHAQDADSAAAGFVRRRLRRHVIFNQCHCGHDGWFSCLRRPLAGWR